MHTFKLEGNYLLFINNYSLKRGEVKNQKPDTR